MAVLDRFIELMHAQHGEALVFAADRIPEVVIAGAHQPAGNRIATREQILALVSEVFGAGFQQQLQGGQTDFSYDSPHGAVALQVLAVGGFAVQVRANTATPPPSVVRDIPSVRTSPPSIPRLTALFHKMLDLKASDLHLKSGKAPMVRIDGAMKPVAHQPQLSAAELNAMIREIMPARNAAEFEETSDTDFAYEDTRGRLRCNVFRDIAGIGAVFRHIPSKILTVEELNLPPAVLELCALPKGLVVVTGPTGSGKSTTLAAMVNWINENREEHLITIEDPVEFVHKDKLCHINHRGVGTETKSFKAALRAALREDPDIVLIGEMRDLETIAIAIETAETGHLVFGTLHTNTASSTVERLIDSFPADRQGQIRSMLSESLKGVIAQTLLKKIGGGRVAALEVLLGNGAVANLIREGKTFQIPNVMQTNKREGMQTMNDAMLHLVQDSLVEPAEAYENAVNRKEMALLLTRNGFRGPWSVE